MKRAALYRRVSTEDQDAGGQGPELRRAAKVRRLEVVLDVEETGSGSRRDRPGLLQVMAAARRRAFDVLLVWSVDRFGRSVLDGLNLVTELRGLGIRFVAVTQGLELGAAGDHHAELYFNLWASLAQWERSMISERTRMGLRRARDLGRQLGRPRLVDAPAPAAVHELRMSGASWAEVAELLQTNVDAARRAAGRR